MRIGTATPRTADGLAQDLERAGIHAGDHLIVHSSLKSLGPVEGGPSTVVDALLRAIGPRGHLMVPTFTYSLPMWNCEPFELKTSPGRVGAIPEAVRRRPDSKRSFHPTHSVAVIGPDAEAIVANHLRATPIGEGSPFSKMYARKAKILMIGTWQDTNSSLHYCEVAAGVDYIHIPFTSGQDYELAWFVNESGQLEYTKIFELPGCSRGFRVVEAPLRELGILRDANVGDAKCQLLDLERLVPAVCAMLKSDPGFMLCRIPSCAICPKRRYSLTAEGSA